ncbi:MAG: Lrp/AsnC family transcriptional regulator [bacterium]
MDKLLKLLEVNGRARPEDLAETLDLSVEEVKNKVKQYEKNGVIQGYRTIINRQKIQDSEVPVVGLIEVTISPQPDTGFDEIAREIYDHPEVTSCHLCSGDYDLLVRVEARDLQSVAEFVSHQLAPNSNVHKTVSHFMLKTYKENGFRFDEPADDHRLSISP